jgi:hypothetical protein
MGMGACSPSKYPLKRENGMMISLVLNRKRKHFYMATEGQNRIAVSP